METFIWKLNSCNVVAWNQELFRQTLNSLRKNRKVQICLSVTNQVPQSIIKPQADLIRRVFELLQTHKNEFVFHFKEYDYFIVIEVS